MDEPKADDRLRMELLCPITQELPTDPVTADDGRVYERSAIAKWFAERKASGKSATSPLTGETMSTKLMPAVQVRNTITLLVENKQIVGKHAAAPAAPAAPAPAPAAPVLASWESCKRKLEQLKEAHRLDLINDKDYATLVHKVLDSM